MSTHTLEWLNKNVLLGNTLKRGDAWHRKASLQGDEPNHYDYGIPVADVHRRLFSWEASKRDVFFEWSERPKLFEGKVAVIRDDTGEAFAVMSDKYQVHQYGEWLVDSVSNLLDDGLEIDSAGLLWGGAVAFVSVGLPENIMTKDGVEFRPNLLATTSHNGRIPTTYKRTSTLVVCDNTWNAAISGAGETVSVRHTLNSALNIDTARNALGIVYELGANIQQELERLCAMSITDNQFQKVVETILPMEHPDPRVVGRAKLQSETLNFMYREHPYCQPWHGTAFGAVQTFNTYRTHVAKVRSKTNRIERGFMDEITGKIKRADENIIRLLEMAR